jgi:tetratricopeptide (TPR) repeat protein
MHLRTRLLIVLGIVTIIVGFFMATVTQTGKEWVNWVRAGNAFNRGVVVMLWDNDYEKAIEYYNEAISLNPDFARAYYKRGEIHFKKAEKLQAEGKSHAEESSKRYKEEIVAYYKEETQKAYTEALEEYRVAVVDMTASLTKEPNFVQGYLTRGIAYYRLKEYQKTIDDTSKALEFNSKLPEALLHRGLAKFGLGNFVEAIEDYEQISELFGINISHQYYAKALLNSAHAYSKLGMKEKAIFNYEIAFKLDAGLPIPEDALAYLVKGKEYLANIFGWGSKLLLKMDNIPSGMIHFISISQSLNALSRAIELDPTLVEAYLARARAYLVTTSLIPNSEEIIENYKQDEKYDKFYQIMRDLDKSDESLWIQIL